MFLSRQYESVRTPTFKGRDEVLDFVEFLYTKTVKTQPETPANKSQLGQRLRQLRAEIVASGEHLFTREEFEKEMASRRGGLQENE
jgi:hypothetical protein